MSDNPRSERQQAPPSYSASVGTSSIILVGERRPTTSDSDLESHLPPPFSITPGTLAISSGSRLIHSSVAGARPLYELSGPLDERHTSTICLMRTSPTRATLDGQARSTKAVPDEDKLYDISSKADAMTSGPGAVRRQLQHAPHHDEVVIRSRHKDQFDVVCLRKHQQHHISLAGGHKRASFDAVGLDEEEHPRIMYQALPVRKKNNNVGVLEWRDGGGMLVAVDTPAALTGGDDEPRDTTEGTLEIVLSLDERHLDLLVALWVARMFEDAKEEARRRRAHEKQLEGDAAHGMLHNLRGTFHI